MSADGVPMHEGDMAGLPSLTLDNIEKVLGEAGFGLADIVRLGVYTPDVDQLLANWAPMAELLETPRSTPPETGGRRSSPSSRLSSRIPLFTLGRIV